MSLASVVKVELVKLSQADYFLGDEQCGYLYSCVDEGEDVIRLNFTPDDFAGMNDSANLSDFRVDL